MKDREDILAHVEDIWRKTEERGIVRNSPFLSERERGLFLEKIKRERGAKFLLLGGEEAERQAFFFTQVLWRRKSAGSFSWKTIL